MGWLMFVVAAGSLGLFFYSGFLWWRMRSRGNGEPNEFARSAIAQERWMTAGLFGIGGALVALWISGVV